MAAAAAAQEVYELCGQMCIMQFYSGRAKKERNHYNDLHSSQEFVVGCIKGCPIKESPSVSLSEVWMVLVAGWVAAGPPDLQTVPGENKSFALLKFCINSLLNEIFNQIPCSTDDPHSGPFFSIASSAVVWCGGRSRWNDKSWIYGKAHTRWSWKS